MLGMTRPTTDLGEGGVYLTNLDRPGRRPRAFYLVGLALATFPAVSGYMRYSGHTENTAFLPATYSMLAILVVWVLNKLSTGAPRNWLSGDAIFLALFWVFHFPYLIYYSFDWAPYDYEVFLVPATVWKATLFSILCLVVFLGGYELTGLAYPPQRHPARLIPPPPAAIAVGKLLVALCPTFMLSVMFSVGIGALMSDYHLLRDIGGATGGRFFWVAQSLGATALILYCSACGLTFQKASRGIAWTAIVIGFALMPLLLGDRGGFIYMAVTPIVAFHYFQRRVGAPLMLAAGIGLMFISTVVGLSRNTVTMNVGQMYSEYQYQTQERGENAVSRALLEFGSSVKTVVVSLDLVPQQHSYWYGRSFWDSLMLAVPNVIPGQTRGGVGLGLGEWLNDSAYGTDRTHGRGGSIAMEAYVNFGYAGALVFFIVLGAGHRALYERFLRRPNLMRTIVLFAFYSGMMLWVRNTSFTFPRTVLWSLAAAWLVQSVFGRRVAVLGPALRAPDSALGQVPPGALRDVRGGSTV